MSETVNLPALGESVTEGTVTRWLVEVGEEVEVDQPIVEVSTDKVDTEVPSPAAGVIEELLVGEDETVEVGAPLVKIGDGSGGGSEDTGSDDAADGDDEQATEEAAGDTEEPTEEAAEEASEPAGEAEGAEATPEESSPAEDTGSSGDGESQEVTLPALGESVTEGTVTRWLVEVGDEIEVDQPLLEVSTDKVDTEVPSPVAGTLQEIKVGEDETVEVGAVLALVGSGAAPEQDAPAEEKPKSEEKPEAEAEADKKPEPEEESDEPSDSEASAEPKAASQKEAPAQETTGGAEGYVTPLVRRLAKKEGIDLSTVTGTGVGGRIRKQDVVEAAEAKKASAAPAASAAAPAAASGPEVEVDTTKRGSSEKAPRIRQVIAQRMNESLEVSAQLTQVHEVDMTRIVNLRNQAKSAFKQANGVNLSYLAFIAVAVTEGLKQHPKLNAEYDQKQQQITYHDAEHLSFAVDTEKGLMVPVISDAGDLNLAGMAKKISDVAARTRSNKIGPNELSGGTFTITNLGSFGALTDTPIINQPQVAILGPGSIVKRPMVVTDAEGNESIGIRHMMYLSLTYDHRLVDGADAGRFMQTLKARLEDGSFESQLGL
ncbi:2-oxoglutarate dehydrogenase, E2 component, dihydrolipoamide succinyltransferase [Nesterenkonia sp. HG001]|uniref:2-oxoglutarate dehydrogenase, E2 component, dihydrolipoamide succinyltransferase n=1 Tax=Nesterenkonia sp. HG001 TaxID=2983207 RepID=UPI002AC3ED0D|nr:2-oxoglutarate dehydrogenase, E2 component, dihydrolipoamide succinyltransferase [Nesterenkonia sp. HG001]MDZ5078436.1 2-oxoglutarate dehydrogenase, E2 component, dihydrolipoamide succinyltransferase [Nesterenkonia sp. HG001]